MGETSYVYIQSEPGLWTVGFYDPTGKWHAESDHESTEAAANRVHYLNSGGASLVSGERQPGMLNWQPDYKRDFATKFVRYKGMPKDPQELVEYLLEFNADFGKQYDAMFEAFREHMNTCVRPIILNPADWVQP